DPHPVSYLRKRIPPFHDLHDCRLVGCLHAPGGSSDRIRILGLFACGKGLSPVRVCNPGESPSRDRVSPRPVQRDEKRQNVYRWANYCSAGTYGANVLLRQLRTLKLRHKTQSEYQVWEEGSKPKQISGDEMMLQKLEYIHNNPVKRGYVDDPIH